VAATSIHSKAAAACPHLRLGGLVANRRNKCGRHGPLLLGAQPAALGSVRLVAAGSGSPAARSPHRSQPAPVDARAPPSLQLG
jgi:hypothetical protein